MPAVRIEEEAFSDERYCALAALTGLPDADCARGKMLRLWRQCTTLGVHVLPELVVVGVLGPKGPSALVESGLGVAVSAGIRIRGTKGRIEWLQKLKKNAAKGGRAKSAKRQPVGSPFGSPESAKSLPPPCPLTLALTLAPSGEEDSLSRERAIPPPSSTGQGEELATSPEPSPEPEPETETTPEKLCAALCEDFAAARSGTAADPETCGRTQGAGPGEQTAPALSLVPITDRQDLRRRTWARLGALRAEVALAHGLTVRPLAAFDPGERELAERIREAGDRAEADIDHVFDVLATEAHAKGQVEWLTGAMFRIDRWVRVLGMTREDATRNRAAPRASWRQPAADEPPRKLRRL